MLTQSEERRLELLQGQVVHSDWSGRFGLNLVTFLQQDRETLAVFFQSRVAKMTKINKSYHTEVACSFSLKRKLP